MVDADRAGSLLAQVPADTPYVYAQLEPLPSSVLDQQLAVEARAYRKLALELERVRKGNPEAAAELELLTRLILAVLAELDGDMSREGLAKLGLDYGGRFAVYGHGIWPVLRFDLASGARLAATVDRVLARVGLEVPTFDYAGYKVWRAGELLGSDAVDLVATIDGDQLVIALAPAGDALAGHLEGVLGAPVGASLADSGELARLAGRHRFSSGGIGFVDVAAVLEHAVSLVPEAEPECKGELRDLARASPRWILGTRPSRDDRLGFRFVIETSPAIRDALERARTPVPGMAAELVQDQLLSLGVALDLRTLADSVRDGLAELRKRPVQCSASRWMVSASESVEDGLSQLLASPARSVLGFNLIVSGLQVSGGFPSSIDAALLIGARDPAVVMSALAELQPGTPVEVKPGAKPVPIHIPLLAGPMFDPVHVASSRGGVGLSAGKGVVFLDLLGREPAAGMPLVLFHADASLWERFSAPSESLFDPTGSSADAGLAAALAELDRPSYRSYTVEARVVGDGVVVDLDLKLRKP